MTLTEKHKEMDHLPGHKEWILLEDVCKKVDKLNEAFNFQAVSNQIIMKMFELIRKEPIYGPMLEDEE